MSTTAADARAPARSLFLKFLALSALLHFGLLVWAAQRMPIAPGGKTFVLQANLIDATTPAELTPPETIPPPEEAQSAPAPKTEKPARKAKRAQSKPRAADAAPAQPTPEATPEAAPDIPAPALEQAAAPKPQPIEPEPAPPVSTDTTPPAQATAPVPAEVVSAAAPAPAPRAAPVIIARSDTAPVAAPALPELRYPDRPVTPRPESASAVASADRNQSGAAVSAPPSAESATEPEIKPAPQPPRAEAAPPAAVPAPTPPAEPPPASPAREVPVIVARSAEPQQAPVVLQPTAPEPRNDEPAVTETRATEVADKENLALAQPSAAAPASAIPAPKELLNSLPSSVEIDYDLSRGEGGFRLGTMKLRFSREGERYSVTTQAKAAGILSLVVSGAHNMETHGVISADGLKPDSFIEQKEYKGKRVDRVQFDHATDTLTYSSDKADQTSRTQPMKANTRDLLSFLFQFTVEPPSDGVIDSTLTTGRKQESFQYEIAGSETLKIGGVEIETLRLTPREAQGKRSIEVWLSPNNHYLPVKIRVKDKGNVIEQVATNIRVE